MGRRVRIVETVREAEWHREAVTAIAADQAGKIHCK